MKFGFILFSCFFFFTACNITAVNESQIEVVDSNAFRWDIPTMGYQHLTFNGPLKNVRIKNNTDNRRLRMNTCGIEVPSKSTDQSPENWFYEFDINGLNTSRLFVKDTAILSLSLDSLKVWRNTGLFSSKHNIRNVKQYESLKRRYPNLQKYPNFLAVYDFAPPLYFPVSYTWEGKPFSEKDSTLIDTKDAYKELGSIDLYKYEFTDKLDTRYHSSGSLNRFFYPDTIFDIINHELIKTEVETNSSSTIKLFYSLDSTYNCNERTRTEYVYNEKGLVIEKLNFSESPNNLNYGYAISLDRASVEPFEDSASYTKDAYFYDEFNRLDSHFVQLEVASGYDKFYYSNNRSIPDSIFSAKPYLNGPTNCYTTIFDSNGNIIKQRFYSAIDKRYLFSEYTMEYSDFDEYNNWKTCKMYLVTYNVNVPDSEPILCFTQQRVYEYYNNN